MRSSKIYTSIALLFVGLLIGGMGNLQAQVDCSAMAFAASNHNVILFDLPTTTACQDPTFVVMTRVNGSGNPFAPHPDVRFSYDGREQASIRDLEPCTRYDIQVLVYCGNQLVGVCTSQGIYATKGCGTPNCNGVTAYDVTDNSAKITVAGFEGCRVGTHLFFELQWRKVGSGQWMQKISQTSATYGILNNLEPCTEYEFRVRVMCDGGYLQWCTGTFKTEGCPCDDCGLSVNSISIQNPTGCNKSFYVSTTMSGNCTIVSYDFDFGNGSSATSVTNPTNWVYSESGRYQVCVTVNAVNGNGDTCAVTYCDSLDVTGCLDCDDCGIELHNFSVLSLQFDQCTKIALVNSEHDEPCTLVNYTFSWGDGHMSTSPFGIAGHTYASDGVYRVCVTVNIDNGFGEMCRKTECMDIMVSGCGQKGPAKMKLNAPLFAYPNPVAAGKALHVIMPEGGAHLKLYDLNGRLVLERSTATGGSFQLQIPDNLPKGVYLLRDEKGHFEPQQILIQ